MALKSEGLNRYTVVCDDPYRRGCSEQIGPYFGHERVVRLAQEKNWYVSEEVTDKHSCPNCMGLHTAVVERKVENGSMTREEAGNSGDPFTAAFIAMAFGGNPLTAGLTTMFTGSTSLGVIVGIMAGDHSEHSEEKPFEGSGGEFGGGGATGTFEEKSEKSLTDQQQGDGQVPPVIVDPFAAQTVESKDADASVTEGKDTAEEPAQEDASADTSPGTSY